MKQTPSKLCEINTDIFFRDSELRFDMSSENFKIFRVLEWYFTKFRVCLFSPYLFIYLFTRLFISLYACLHVFIYFSYLFAYFICLSELIM